MLYLGWADFDPKKPAQMKITQGAQAFAERFHTHPNVVLVNPADVCEVEGLRVQVEARIQRNNFQFGIEQQ